MAIDTSGDWWTSPRAEDIEPYLCAYAKEEGVYPINAYRAIRCPCGSHCFEVQRAADVTRRECTACRSVEFVCRNADDWAEAVEEGVETCICVECESRVANIGVGFASYSEPDADAVKWFYVGVRCASCGILACYNDGKVGYGPAEDVYRSV